MRGPSQKEVKIYFLERLHHTRLLASRPSIFFFFFSPRMSLERPIWLRPVDCACQPFSSLCPRVLVHQTWSSSLPALVQFNPWLLLETPSTVALLRTKHLSTPRNSSALGGAISPRSRARAEPNCRIKAGGQRENVNLRLGDTKGRHTLY